MSSRARRQVPRRSSRVLVLGRKKIKEREEERVFFHSLSVSLCVCVCVSLSVSLCLSLSLSLCLSLARATALKAPYHSAAAPPPHHSQSSTGHPGPSHAALCPVPLQASHGTLPRPLQAGHSLHPSSSEQNLSEPTVRAPLPRQNSQLQAPEPPQQSHGAEGVFLWEGFLEGFGVEREREKEEAEKKKSKKNAPRFLMPCRQPRQTTPSYLTFALTAHASSSRFCSCLARSGSM